MLFSVETVRLSRGNTGTRLRVTRSSRKRQKVFSTRVREKRRTTGFFGLSTSSSVPLHPVQELLSTFRVFDVLDPDVHPLLDVSVANDFVDDDTNSTRGDVINDASPSVDGV